MISCFVLISKVSGWLCSTSLVHAEVDKVSKPGRNLGEGPGG